MTSLMRVRAVTNGWTGGPGLNTFYFKPPAAAPVQADVNDVAARVRTAFGFATAHFPTSWSLTVNPQVDVIEDTNGLVVNSLAATPPAVLAGGSPTGFGPAFVVAVGRLGTNAFILGKRLKGRAFIGPFMATDAQSAAPAAGLRTDVGAILGNLLTGTTASTLQVWRRPNKVTGALGTSSVVTATSVSTVWGSLRSRRD